MTELTDEMKAAVELARANRGRLVRQRWNGTWTKGDEQGFPAGDTPEEHFPNAVINALLEIGWLVVTYRNRQGSPVWVELTMRAP